jgi:hypothetical protein
LEVLGELLVGFKSSPKLRGVDSRFLGFCPLAIRKAKVAWLSFPRGWCDQRRGNGVLSQLN